jgi:hypothetical protein
LGGFVTLKKIYFLPLILILFLTGCSKRNRRIINNFNNRPNDFEHTQKEVKLGAKFLSHDEFNAFFKSPSFWARKTTSKNYQAILLNIKNFDTKNSYLIKSTGIKLDLVSPDEVYESLKANTVARGITGLVVYPILGLLAGTILYLATAALIGSPYNILWIYGALSIPFILCGFGIYKGIKSCIDPTKKNHKFHQKLLKQSASLEQEAKIIKTNETFNAMFFVEKKNLKNSFPVLLLDPITKEKTLEFNIPVPVDQLCS